MKPPEVGQGGWRDRRFAERVGGPAQAGAGLRQVVLQQPCLGEQHAERQFVLAGEGARSKGWLQQLRGVGPAAALEGGVRARQKWLKRHACHGYEVYIACLLGW